MILTSTMPQYKLLVDLNGVDSITGIIAVFKGSIKGSKGRSRFNQGQTPYLGSFDFETRGKGDLLTGSLSFQDSVTGAHFSSEGISYAFVNPGKQNIRIPARQGEKSIKIDLSRSSPLTNTGQMRTNLYAVGMDSADMPGLIVDMT